MHTEELRTYCLSKKAVSEGFPFDDTTLVLKVAGKMFALISLENDLRISLKCDPEKAIELRERYPAVIPGYHTSKKHWNTISIDNSIPDTEIYAWIDWSYNLVVSGLTRKTRAEHGID